MAFVVSTRFVPPMYIAAVREAGRRVAGGLRRLGAQTAMSPQQRAERYVARMPTSVLGAC